MVEASSRYWASNCLEVAGCVFFSGITFLNLLAEVLSSFLKGICGIKLYLAVNLKLESI
jgi:hypothetical protein